MVALGEVAALNTDPGGILIQTRDGKVVVAQAGQKGVGATILRLRVHADRIIDELTTAVDEAYRRSGLRTPRAIRRRLSGLES